MNEPGLFPPDVDSELSEVVTGRFPQRLEWFLRLRQGSRLEFLRQADYWFSDAPDKLIYRFFLEVPENPGWEWLNTNRFPPQVAARANLADRCRVAIIRANGDSELRRVPAHTLESMKEIYTQERQRSSERYDTRPTPDFDLHDVYVCMEAFLMEVYGYRTNFDSHDPNRYDEGRAELELDPWQAGAVNVSVMRAWRSIRASYSR